MKQEQKIKILRMLRSVLVNVKNIMKHFSKHLKLLYSQIYIYLLFLLISILDHFQVIKKFVKRSRGGLYHSKILKLGRGH